jgi:hypothetical protein
LESSSGKSSLPSNSNVKILKKSIEQLQIQIIEIISENVDKILKFQIAQQNLGEY